MNIVREHLKHWQPIKLLSAFALTAILSACGGNSNQESTDTSIDDSEQGSINAAQTIDVSQVRSLKSSTSSRVGATSTGTSDFVESGTLNSTGEFSHPNPADQFTGTLTAAFEVSDEEGIARAFLAFAQSDLELPICEENCGTTLGAVVTGINPVIFELISGEQTLQVWVEDNEGNLDLVDTVNINWQAKVINGVSANYDEETETISVSWNPLEDMLRYNVYLATDSALNGRNVLELEGGDTRLALTTTSTSFLEKELDNYFIVVTGVDGTGESAFSDQVQLINDLTQAPTAANDEFETQEDTELTGNLLTNDESGAEELILDTDLVSEPTFGSVTLSSDGTFIYTPNANVNGSDQFSYQVENEFGLTAQAVVQVTITAQNDAPNAFDDNYTIDADLSPLTISAPGLLLNDTDIDGDALTIIATPFVLPSLGQVVLSEDGGFVYTPSDDFVNFDSFEYQVSDGSELTASALVTISTADFNGHIPIAANDTYSVNEDEVLIVTVDEGILNNDSDSDNITSELAISVLTAAQNGSVIIANDGSFDYSPLPNFNGVDSFSYQIADPDGNQSSATVTITVSAQNDAPTANNNTYLVAADSTFTLNDLQGILANDSDVDGDDIKLSHFNNTEILLSTGNTISTTSGSIVISKLGGFTYTPNSAFEGTDSVTYQITDGNLVSTSASIQFIVEQDYFETNDSTPITLLDLSDDILEIRLSDDDVSAENGTLSIENDELIYTPTSGSLGADLITINLTVVDADNIETTIHLQYYISVIATNTAPVANADSASATLYQSVNIDVLANDTDTEGDVLTIIAQSALNGTVSLNSDGTLAYVPDDDATSDTISYTIQDPAGLTSSSTVTITIDNTAPIANTDTASATLYQTIDINVLANDTDAEGDVLTIIAQSALNGTVSLNSDGTLAYVPDDDATSDTISYTIQDPAGLTSSSTVTVFIDNTAPVAVADSATATLYQMIYIDVLANDTDAEGDVLTITAQSALHGTVSLNSDSTLAYTPDDDATADTISYTIQDPAGLTSSSTVNVSISNAPALGSHDLDNDTVTELSISFSDDLTTWTLNFDSTNTLVIKEVDGRYYPVEPDTTSGESVVEISVSDDALEHDYKVLKNGSYYEVKLSDMATSGVIELNRVATPLSTDVDELDFPAAFLNLVAAPNGNTTYHTATANRKYVTGESYTFNSDGTGGYADHKENETFSWTATDNVLDIVVDKTSETYSAYDLYSKGIISETAYNDYIDADNDESTEYQVVISALNVEITIDDNKLAYISATEKVSTTYTIPDDFGGGSTTIDEDDSDLRWYNKETLSLNDFSPLDNDGQWLLPLIDEELDLTSNVVLTETEFYSDNTGLMTRLDTSESESFTWSFTGDGVLNIDSTSLTLSYLFFGQLSHSQYVLVEKFDESYNLVFSSATLASYRKTVDMSEVSTYLRSGLAVGLVSSQDTENYNDAGYFTGEDFFGFDLSNNLSDISGNTSIYDATRYIFSETSSYITDNYWTESGQDITINRYVDTNFNQSVCDPDNDSSCVVYTQRSWQVISYDEESGLVWVIEDRKYLDSSSIETYPFDPANVDYTYLFVSRLNAYQTYSSNNLVDDTATTNEDTTVTSIDVLANDLNSENSASGLTVVGAYSDSGNVTVNDDNTIDFTPSENLYGDANVIYMASDGLGGISVATLTVTVTAVNDAPVFDTDSSATELSLAENTANGSVFFYPYASDAEGDTISWSLTNEDNVLTVDSSSGEVSIYDNSIFDYESQTSYEFTLVMTDSNGDYSSQIITINITDENDAPELSANISLTLPENQTGAAGYITTASDLEGDAYTISWSDGMGIISGNFDDSNTANDTLELDIISAFDYEMLNIYYSAYDLDGDSTNGVFEYEFKVAAVQDDDSDKSDSQNVTLYITDVNEAPTLTSVASTTATEGQSYYYSATVEDEDDDNDGAELTWSLDNQPADMTISSTGEINWAVPYGVTTSGTVTITVSDGEYSDTEDFTVTVSSDPLLTSLSFQDQVIQACVLSAHEEDARVSDVTNVWCDNATTLADLPQFSNLRFLQITNVGDWSALSSLNLNEYSTFGTPNIDDWSRLSSQSNLVTMTLYGVNYSAAEWTFISNFDLNYLNLDLSNFDDISLVTDMTNLQSLLLSDTDVTDWSKLADLQLTYFTAENTSFSSISNIQHMTGLTTLRLDNNSISDWSTLSSFNLSYFSASNSNFDDIGVISHMTNLDYLYLVNSSVMDWSALSNLTLTIFNTNGNYYFDDLSLLANSSNLQYLDIGNTLVTDFSYLANYQLYQLNVEGTSFNDLTHINNSISTLSELSLSYSGLGDISSLTSFTALEYLYADLSSADSAQVTNETLISLDIDGVNIWAAPDIDGNETYDYFESDYNSNSIFDYFEAQIQAATDLSSVLDYTPADGVGDEDKIVSFSDGNNSQWFEQTDDLTTGNSALRSGSIVYGEESILTATINTDSKYGELKFDLKVSSDEELAYIEIYVNDYLEYSFAGEQDWKSQTIYLNPGTSVIEWIYYKDDDTSTGEDAVWIDNLTVTLYEGG